MRPEMRYRLQILRKLRKGYAPTWRFYSEAWSNFSEIFSFGVLYPYRCTDWGEIWRGGPPSVQCVATAVKKAQNRYLSNLYRRSAMHAMLPVTKCKIPAVTHSTFISRL